ncbi:uncharacterized protein L3040_007373 [Drepanopeziza brunnea f. sp. 'multigermtubi']|uniref:uncharacterized protein n=1 Tax=Drepanopeziza brunnea f. sp. 'multigermtubi' TaxID=698441 RepID=UPI002381E5C4|nr:hypothetical protein L3040_007373 [Drepanopeziza brunnea f. sp. 'multigermtubi']
MHRRETQSAGSLSAISEYSISFLEPRSPPPVPPRAWNRLGNENVALNYGTSQLPYSHFDETASVHGPNREKLENVKSCLKENKYIAKIKGWKRLGLIAVVAILCLVGLIHIKDNFQLGQSRTQHHFPSRLYRFDTYLSTTTTNCTSNPATWRCYPYFTYSQSPSQATAIFDWIIIPVPNTHNNYTISSTANPFSISFANAPLILKDAAADNEHYSFQTRMRKTTTPVRQLGSENVAAKCIFNSTIFQGTLCTKMAKTYKAKNETDGMETQNDENDGSIFKMWPYAVKVELIAAAGSGTPTCLDPSGNSLGDFSVVGAS